MPSDASHASIPRSPEEPASPACIARCTGHDGLRTDRVGTASTPRSPEVFAMALAEAAGGTAHAGRRFGDEACRVSATGPAPGLILPHPPAPISAP